MSLSQQSRIGIIVGVLALVLIGLTWRMVRFDTSPSPVNTAVADPARQTYAGLYQAAWRQDEGRGSVLMTATLMVPTLQQLLGDDPGRSETEDQLWRSIKDTSSKQIPIFVTIDSIAGPISDEVMTNQSSLVDEQGTTYRLENWKPFIVQSRVVNSDEPANAQAGVLIFSADQDLDWSILTELRLEIQNVGEVPVRKFIWTQPSLLAD